MSYDVTYDDIYKDCSVYLGPGYNPPPGQIYVVTRHKTTLGGYAVETPPYGRHTFVFRATGSNAVMEFPRVRAYATLAEARLFIALVEAVKLDLLEY